MFPGQIWEWNWELKMAESSEFGTLRTFKLFPENQKWRVLGMFQEQKKLKKTAKKSVKKMAEKRAKNSCEKFQKIKNLQKK